MRYLLFSFFLFIASGSLGQINQKGLPIIRNFSPEDYDASDQNWAAVMDHRGIMYFGNNSRGVLEYDGRSWRRIPVVNDAIVRSLAVDSIGTVYVGTIGDFGYLSPSAEGKLEYKSLVSSIADSIGTFSDINRIHNYKGKIYFYNRNYIFIYNGVTVNTLDINPNREYYNLFSFVANNKYYIGSFRLGLRQLIDNKTIIAPNGDFFKGKDIIGITEHSNNQINVVTNDGIYRYNQESGSITEITKNNSFYKRSLEDAFAYHAIPMYNSSIGISYIYGDQFSFAKIDSSSQPIYLLNKSNGLLDETVAFAYQDTSNKKQNPLWLPLNVGIARVDIHSPINRFSEESGLRGAILNLTSYNGKLFVLTMSGVYYLDKDKNGLAHFKQIPDINISAWSSLIFKNPKTGKEHFLIGTTHQGIFEITNNYRAINISNSDEFKGKLEHIAYSLTQSKKNPSEVYIGMGGSLAAMKWENGTWKNIGEIEKSELNREYRSLAFTSSNVLWLGTYINGISRIDLDNNLEVNHYGINDGLHALLNNYVFKVDDKVYFGTGKGVYHFNEETKIFEPAILPGLNSTIEGRGVYRIDRYKNGYALACYNNSDDKWVELVLPHDNNTDLIIRQPFKSLPNRAIDAVFTDSNGILWIALSNELYSFDESINRNYKDKFNALIRKVTTKDDSILFHGTFVKVADDGRLITSKTQQPKQIPTLSFKFNNITFDVASSFYEKVEYTEYSWILVGYEKTWTRWTTVPMPIYTNLSEGSYTFKVKARNVYGVESSVAEYSFSINPPWYRSILAIILYVILLALLIWGIVVYNTRRLIEEKIRLEQIVKERTAEVVAQKEELEVQRDKIFEQNEEIKSSINYASRIQNALLTPKETIDEIFNDYFILFLPRDIVSGDFYWHAQIGSRKICVISDCTGHGVPGGFMSMLGIAFLTQIMAKGDRLSASQILDQLRVMIITSLHQTGKSGESKDGMDLALYIIDTETETIEFAGANNPMVIVRDNEIIQIKGDKMPIGIHIKCDSPFTNNVMEYKKDDVIYTFSDGFADQFGGPSQRKFMIKNLKELFLEIHSKPMDLQKDILYKTLQEWQGSTPRIDDIVVMGLRL
jgi:serine phosphatase RsbU (regulator of sigma subunit)